MYLQLFTSLTPLRKGVTYAEGLGAKDQDVETEGRRRTEDKAELQTLNRVAVSKGAATEMTRLSGSYWTSMETGVQLPAPM